MNKRIEEIKSVNGNIHYDDLNEDVIFKTISKESKDKNKIYELINNIRDKYQILTFKQLLTLFKIIIDIRDFALGGNFKEISKI